LWEKEKAANFFNANRQVLKIHEDVCVFYSNQCVYNPQKQILNKPYNHKNKSVMSDNFGNNSKDYNVDGYTEYNFSFPKSIIRFSKEKGGIGSIHSTQKPVALCEYLIRTYTNEGDTVLDNCMGSGTTRVACRNLNRDFIGIEKEPEYFEIAKQRIENPDYVKPTKAKAKNIIKQQGFFSEEEIFDLQPN
jgi:site-specific DNA-methyltransferase (adenine-specific)